nr:MAG TPA_asm: hypothetical protein [Caudoviricetes sp.]
MNAFLLKPYIRRSIASEYYDSYHVKKING